MAGGVRAIARRLGADRAAEVETALAAGDLAEAVSVLLTYYDAGYQHRTTQLRRPILDTVEYDCDLDVLVAATVL